VYPGNVLQSFEALCWDAKERGALADVESAAQIIHSQLQTDPRHFGDPCYTLPATQQLVYMRGVKPLVVYYAVHRSKDIVIVQKIAWLPPKAH
jgi:hypothetical protein